ncbi:MAG: TIGR04100 family radical SAM protein [Firmicutes bacterium]|nr:TIGR04100 family radical SAM protein [Bacillota bacterium]
MTILYKVHNNLYVNLTNRCPYSCTFCLRMNMDTVSAVDQRPLWLEREPSLEEIIQDFDNYNMDEFNEVVFCGYGEPTERLDVVFEVAKFVKEKFNKPTRINTNGMANLIWNRDTTPEFKGLINTVSISLNHPDAKEYQALVRSKFGEQSHAEMLKFAKNVKQYVDKVVMTTVDTTITKEQEAECQKICDELGITYRIRPWEG